MSICALIVGVVDTIGNTDVVCHDCSDHIGVWSFGCGNDCVCRIGFLLLFWIPLDRHIDDIYPKHEGTLSSSVTNLWSVFTAGGYDTSLISGPLKLKVISSIIHPHNWYGFPQLILTTFQWIGIITLYLTIVSFTDHRQFPSLFPHQGNFHCGTKNVRLHI